MGMKGLDSFETVDAAAVVAPVEVEAPVEAVAAPVVAPVGKTEKNLPSALVQHGAEMLRASTPEEVAVVGSLSDKVSHVAVLTSGRIKTKSSEQVVSATIGQRLVATVDINKPIVRPVPAVEKGAKPTMAVVGSKVIPAGEAFNLTLDELSVFMSSQKIAGTLANAKLLVIGKAGSKSFSTSLAPIGDGSLRENVIEIDKRDDAGVLYCLPEFVEDFGYKYVKAAKVGATSKDKGNNKLPRQACLAVGLAALLKNQGIDTFEV